MPNYKKGEPANRSKNRKDVFTPGKVQESGSLGYMVASLMRALARSKDKKAISKLAKTPSGSSRKYPKSNVKVKKTAVKKTPQYRANKSRVKPTPGNKEFYATKPSREKIAAKRDATKPSAKKKAPAKKRTAAQIEKQFDLEREIKNELTRLGKSASKADIAKIIRNKQR